MKRLFALAVLAMLAISCQDSSQPLQPEGRDLAASARPGTWIVVFKPGTDHVPELSRQLVNRAGGKLQFVYQHAIRGFSAGLPIQAVDGIRHDPHVAYVEADRPAHLFAQTIPTGVERIFADANPNIDIDGLDDYRVDAGVAIIDTGIDFQHPELNVVDGVDCSGGSPMKGSCQSGGDDDHYHGTHVAGTVAAIDNGAGVVGVAPGARLYAVKVLNKNGSGWTSWIVAGIDWVAAHSGEIDVANMSLGGSGFSQAEYDAIQGAVNAGVAFAVAAGNDGADAANYSPSGFDNVLTVSALADFDGQPGGNGSPTCRTDQDDTLADFSNWGSAVDVAAPGVCILSTFPIEQGSYGTISGTSMASPHATGALALLASRNHPHDATDVANLYAAVENAGNYDWTDDSGDGIQEPLLDVSGFDPVLVPGGGGGGGTNVAPTASFTSSCAGLSCSFDGSGSSDSDGTITAYDWDFGDGAAGSGVTANHDYAAAGTYTVTLVVTDDGGAADTTSHGVTVSSGSTSSVTVTGISPDQVAAGNSVGVTISGSGFAAGAAVSLENGSGPAPGVSNVTVVDGGTITADVSTKGGGPPRNRVWDVRVTNPDGGTGVLAGGFTITP